MAIVLFTGSLNHSIEKRIILKITLFVNFSINNLKSFKVAKIIYEKLLDMTGKIHVPIILVGNKVDLHLERCVSTQEGRDLANHMKAQFAEVR